MIGDRKHDIIGAKENRLDSIGVLYGYGDREELSQAGADYIVEDIAGLRNLFAADPVTLYRQQAARLKQLGL